MPGMHFWKPTWTQSSWFILVGAEVSFTEKKQLNIMVRIQLITWLYLNSFRFWLRLGPPSQAFCKITKGFFHTVQCWPLRCLGLTGRRFQIKWDLWKSLFSSCSSCSMLKTHVYISFMVTEFLPKESLIHKSAALIIIDLMIPLQCQLNGMKN